MSVLVEFATRVEEQLSAATREPNWEFEEAERYMAAVAVRRQRFEQLASRLIQTVVQPRLETLAGYFPNASLPKDEPAGRCSCWFGYCERFPASTKIAFEVEHDVRFEKVAVCYEASMKPVFIKLNERDKITSPLDEVQDDAVAEWVELRLLEFLEAYLRIDRGGDDFDEEAATDPVCGMRITRSGDLAPGLVSYLGRTEHMTATQFHEMVNHESGLLRVSDTSSDMRDLLAHEADDVRAAEAVALFCYQAKKWIGSFAAALGGLDTLVFAGGIRVMRRQPG